MRKWMFLLLISSFNLLANTEAMITNLDGDVRVNGLEISKKTKIANGYKITVKEDKDSFAVISFNSGQRLLLLSGEIIIDKISSDLTKIMLNDGEFYLHVVNPDERLITTMVEVSTKNSIFKLNGGDSFFKKDGDKLYFAQIKGISIFNSPWGKINLHKEKAIKIESKNEAPEQLRIPYKILNKIKLEFERMGVNL